MATSNVFAAAALVSHGFVQAGTCATSPDGFQFAWKSDVVNKHTVGQWLLVNPTSRRVLYAGVSAKALRGRIPHVLQMADATKSIAQRAKQRGANTKAGYAGDAIVARFNEYASGCDKLVIYVKAGAATDRDARRDLLTTYNPAINVKPDASNGDDDKPAAKPVAKPDAAKPVAKPAAKPAHAGKLIKRAALPAPEAKPADDATNGEPINNGAANIEHAAGDAPIFDHVDNAGNAATKIEPINNGE